MVRLCTKRGTDISQEMLILIMVVSGKWQIRSKTLVVKRQGWERMMLTLIG